MSLQIEKLEKNMAVLTIEVPAEELDKALEAAFQKNKGKISVPGFRKGKVPRQMIEKMYGPEIFYEDAANTLIGPAYEKAVEECEEEIVSSPKVEVTQIEKGKTFIFTAEVALKPEVKLGKYKGVTVEKLDIEVSEEEIDNEINKEREENARTIAVEDRAVENGDMTVIDFEGFVDGVAFEGGKGENYPLTIGSGSFIPGFEEQLIGAKLDEETEVNVTFPEDYHAENLAGKPAMFKVTVKEIKVKELPKLDDEFAQDVSEFDTLAEYKADIKKNLTEKKKDAAKKEKEMRAVDAAVENATMEIPELMVKTQVNRMVEDFAQRLQSQGLSIDQYIKYVGGSPEQFIETMRPEALKRIKNGLVLEAVVKAEKIEVADADVEAEIEKMAAAYGMEVDKVKEFVGDEEKNQIRQDLAVQKAVELIGAKAVEKAAEKAEKEE